MKVTLLLLVGLFMVASARRWGDTMRDVRPPRRLSCFNWNSLDIFRDKLLQRDDCGCVSKRITVDEKIRLIGIDNDNDNDGLVKFDDLYFDVTERYDTNKDGFMSERECINQVSCAYGNTEQVSQFVCALAMRGQPSGNIANFNNPPYVEGQPLDVFLENARSRYVRFFNDRCVNCDISLDRKLELDLANNNYNNDSVVTSEDIYYDLKNRYDTNKDGNVTQAEFVASWICHYADTGDYARYIWNQISQGAPSITIFAFNNTEPFNTTGMPLEQFKTLGRQNYEKFRTMDISHFVQFQA